MRVPLTRALVTGWAIAALLMTALWLAQKRTRNAGVVDAGWTLLTGGLGIWLAWLAAGYFPRRMLVIVLAGGWAMRLGTHLLRRVLNQPEESRYRRLREQWGADADRRLFLLFQLHAVSALLFAAPMAAAAANTTRFLNGFDAAGALVGFIAIQGGMVADRQLARFRKDAANGGRVLRAGLWRYSPHPNYFFEWLHWWSYALIAATGAWWWVALLGPILMYARLRTRSAFLPRRPAR
jgi:steroid 5-alpha reductase family enzyme